MTWRKRAAEVIARVRAEHPTATGAELGPGEGSVGCRACGGKGKARASAADERQTSMEVQS